MAPRFPLLLLLLPLALPPVSGSCGGGGSQVPDGAPVITAVSPGAFAGYPARMVTFRATASNNPISWDWSFGGGATPSAAPAIRWWLHWPLRWRATTTSPRVRL
ncbi:MAG TPA: hypothetical protein VEI97_11930, partial [bacterium]|nr:hypothetical protein [bacterium]